MTDKPKYSARIEQLRFGWNGRVVELVRNMSGMLCELDTSCNPWRPSRRWVEHTCRKAMARYARRDARREAAYRIDIDGKTIR